MVFSELPDENQYRVIIDAKSNRTAGIKIAKIIKFKSRLTLCFSMAFWLLLFTRLYQVNELRREPNCSSSAPVIYGFMYLGYLLDSPLNIKQRSSRLFEGHRGSRLKLWFRICRLRNSIARTEINLFTKPRVVISIEIITWISTAGGTMHSDTWLDPKTKNSRESMPLKPEERQVGFRSYSRQKCILLTPI